MSFVSDDYDDVSTDRCTRLLSQSPVLDLRVAAVQIKRDPT